MQHKDAEYIKSFLALTHSRLVISERIRKVCGVSGVRLDSILIDEGRTQIMRFSSTLMISSEANSQAQLVTFHVDNWPPKFIRIVHRTAPLGGKSPQRAVILLLSLVPLTF
jgi:hypothetical protein